MQLGRFEAPVEPGLRAAIEAFDCGNPEVNGYLQRYAETIVAHGLGTVLVLTEEKEILGFVSLSFSSIVLTNSEKGTFRAVRTAFGALRIGSIRTAVAHQGRSCGSTLLYATVGLAHRVSDFVGVRFLVADANNDHVGWYGRRGWVPNDARRERDRLEGRNVTSMRFDLQRPAVG
jgi:hypothetical protein